MAGSEMSNGYVLACLNTASGLVEDAAKSLNDDTNDNDTQGEISPRHVGESCGSFDPGITPPRPSGEGCYGGIDLAEKISYPSARDALMGAAALLKIVSLAVGSLSSDQVYYIQSS